MPFRIPLDVGFSEKYHVSPLSIIGTLFRYCIFGQGTLPSHATLDSCVNENLIGQICVRLVAGVEMAESAVRMLQKGS